MVSNFTQNVYTWFQNFLSFTRFLNVGWKKDKSTITLWGTELNQISLFLDIIDSSHHWLWVMPKNAMEFTLLTFDCHLSSEKDTEDFFSFGDAHFLQNDRQLKT